MQPDLLRDCIVNAPVSASGRGREISILVAVLAMAAVLRLPHLLEPWIGHHTGWGGAMYGNIARNFLRYGYSAIGFGPLANFGVVEPVDHEYYFHYPPLLVWLVSLSYRLFGVHEWSARLVSLVASLGTIVLLYATMRRAYTVGAGLTAAFLLAIVPLDAYYGTHVDVYGPANVFFTLLGIWGYARWHEHGRDRDLAIAAAGVIAGCMIAWATYFVVPLMLGHYLVTRGWKGAPFGRLALLGAIPFATFAFFMLHRRALLPETQEIMGMLAEKFTTRFVVTGAGSDIGSDVLGHALQAVRLHTTMLVLLAAAGLAMIAVRVIRNRSLAATDGLVLVMLGYGVLHNLVFFDIVAGGKHEFMSRLYTIGLVAAAAVALHYGWNRVGPVLGLRTTAVLGISLIGVIALSAARTIRVLYSIDPSATRELVRSGAEIQAITEPDAVLAVAGRYDLVFQFYADRSMHFRIETPDDLTALPERRGRPTYLLLPADADTVPDWRPYAERPDAIRLESRRILVPVGDEPGLTTSAVTDTHPDARRNTVAHPRW